MQLTKRIIAGVLCILLFVGAVVCWYNPSPIFVGRGSWQNAEIRSLEDMNIVLKSLEELGANSPSAALPVAAAEEEVRYSSATVTETTNLYMTGGSATASLRRKLQMSLTTDTAYYVSDGQLIVHSRSEGTSSYQEQNVYMDFSVCIYMREDRVLIKADRMEYRVLISTSEETTLQTIDEYNVFDNHLGEWIDCSSEPALASIFLSLNSFNVQTLSDLGRIIDEEMASEKSLFDLDGAVYMLKEDVFAEWLGLSGTDVDGAMNIDLSKAQAPLVLLDYRYSAGSQGINLYMSLEDRLVFENINNTEIRFTGNVEITDIRDLIEEVE